MANTDSLMWEQSKQVSTNLIVKLNGGTTEGTNQFTYNGSTAKSINITASSVGAAASNHTHNYAAASHNHSAANITSGTLPIARGGTGVTANPSMLVNLASTSAASVFAASPRPGVTGTLPLTRGGTGATTALAANYNILSNAKSQDSGWSDNTNFAYFTDSPSTSNGALMKYPAGQIWADWLQKKTRNPYKVLIIMDSYGQNYTTTWLNEINANKLWKAGSNFNADDSNSWYNWIGPELDDLDLSQYDKILIMGGFNDRNASQESIFSGMQKTYDLIEQKITNKGLNINSFGLYIGHIGWSSTLSSTERDEIVRRSLPAYYKCQKYGFTYMTNIEYTLHSYNLFNSDNVHPNSSGAEAIHRQVQQFLKTGSCDVHKDYMTRSITSSGVTGSYNVGYILDNEITRLYLPYDSIHFSTPKRFHGDAKIQLLQVESSTASQRGYVMGMFDNQNNVQHQILLNGFFTVSSGLNVPFVSMEGMKFTIEVGFLYCYCNMLNLDNNGWIDFYASDMQIRTGQIFLPTLEC